MQKVIVSDYEIPTLDGVCNAAFVHPETGSWPGVLIWTDAGGLRPTMVEMAERLAFEGYSVLVPNPFYRVTREQLDFSHFDFKNPAHMAKLQPLFASVNTPGNTETDVQALVSFLSSRDEVDKMKKMGTHGYCMGGKLALKTCALALDRMRAAASFHGGGLVTENPDSPHRLAVQIHARIYIGIAKNDDEKQPEAKEILREAFATAQVPAEIEVYGSLHGWCVPDMPPGETGPIYNEHDAERAWAKLLALYKVALA